MAKLNLTILLASLMLAIVVQVHYTRRVTSRPNSACQQGKNIVCEEVRLRVKHNRTWPATGKAASIEYEEGD